MSCGRGFKRRSESGRSPANDPKTGRVPTLENRGWIAIFNTPKAIQDLLDELEASKKSRVRALNVLQRLRLVLSEAGHVAIPPPSQKTFDEEGEILETALTKSLRIRRNALKSVPLSGRCPSRKNAKAIIRTLFRRCGKL